MQKILLVTQYFWPETFRINDLAIELVKLGYEVDVLTGKPNYPQGKIYEGYSFFSHRKDNYNGVCIIRIPLIPRGNGKGIRLMLNYLSYVFFSCFYIITHRKKYDVSLTFAISPITQAYPALLHKRLYKSKAILWVQDLWPESVTAAGKIKSTFILSLLNKMVTNIYSKTDQILVQSKAFIPSVLDKRINENKISYIPNWAEDIFLSNNNDFNRFKNLLPEGFIVMFAGNIGEAQDFDSILKAVSLTKHITEIKWVIVGDGRRKSWVEEIIEEKKWHKTVFLLGKLPVEDMPDLFVHANIMLMTLKDAEIFSMTIPSKLQSYMAYGKPIATMLNGIGNKVVEDAKCGYTASAGDYKKLAENIMIAYHEKKEILDFKGLNGKDYYGKNFSKDIILEELIQIIST